MSPTLCRKCLITFEKQAQLEMRIERCIEQKQAAYRY